MIKEYHFKEHKLKVLLEDDSITFVRGKNDLMIHKSMRGENKVLFNQITGIKYQEPTALKKGFIQFSIPRTNIVGVLRSMDQGSNAIVFNKKEQEMVNEIKVFVENRLSNINAQSESPTEQIKEYKELLDSGIITQEEFDMKKKELLNL